MQECLPAAGCKCVCTGGIIMDISCLSVCVEQLQHGASQCWWLCLFLSCAQRVLESQNAP